MHVILKIYPNPTTGEFTLQSKTGEPLHYVNIYSYDGRLVKSIVGDGSVTMKINLSEFTAGIYLAVCEGVGSLRVVRE